MRLKLHQSIKPLNTHVNFNLFYGKRVKTNQEFNYLSH